MNSVANTFVCSVYCREYSRFVTVEYISLISGALSYVTNHFLSLRFPVIRLANSV